VFGRRVLKRISGPRRKEATGGCIMRSFIPWQTISGVIKSKADGRGM